MIPIYVPDIQNSLSTAHLALSSGWISNYGEYVKKAEEALCQRFGVKHAILMNSGTGATHCLMIAMKKHRPGINRVYVPNNVFVVPWNAVLREYSRGVIEVTKTDPLTGNMDTSEEYLRSLAPNSGLVIVHNLGNIINVPRIKRIRPDLLIVEDNCEGAFGKHEGEMAGSSSLCSALSFYANKTITTGEGGAFLTNDDGIAKHIRKVYSHGMTEQRYIHDAPGYNYRMTNIEAALLYAQLEDLELILSKKRKVFERYDDAFRTMFSEGKLKKFKNEDDTVAADWMYVILTPGIAYDVLGLALRGKGVETRPLFYDIRRHEHLKDLVAPYPEDLVFSQGLMLPSHPGLSAEDQDVVIRSLVDFLHEEKLEY